MRLLPDEARLGVNHGHIPVNAPCCPFHSYHRDGAMRMDGNAASRIGYEPNSKGERAEQPDLSEPPLRLDGHADRWDHREDDDYYSQPRALFNLMNDEQKNILFDNTARSVGGASKEIQIRHIRNGHKADTAYGKGVAKALGLLIDDVLAA